MRFAVTSDIHAPLMLKDFEKSLNEINKEIEYFFLLGDIIDKNQHFYLKKIYAIIKEYFPNIIIYSVFGNNEYFTFRDLYKKEYSYLNWIDDSIVEIENYYILGTEGVLDSLTSWMKKNTPWIKETWNERLRKIENLLENVKDKKVILLSHYGLSSTTVSGDPALPSLLASKKMEEIIKKYSEKIKIALHGHSHLAKIWKTKINETEIYNISFYIHKKPLIFEI